MGKELEKAGRSSFILAPVSIKLDTPDDYGINAARYLQAIGCNEEISKSRTYKEFCEVSEMSFHLGGCQRFKEGPLKKRSGGRFKHETQFFYCGKCCRMWSEKWFIVTNDFVAYLRSSESETIHEIMLFDASFKVEYGRASTGRDNGIMIYNSTRALFVEALTNVDQILWVQAMKEAFSNSEWNPNRQKRFESFAPVRSNNLCSWFVDGESYFEAVHNALTHAERDVFITDWWLSPKIYLKRPVAFNKNSRTENQESWRLDKILQNLVYILYDIDL